MGVAAVAAVVGLAGTGIVGSENNTVILGIASSQFVGEGVALRTTPLLLR